MGAFQTYIHSGKYKVWKDVIAVPQGYIMRASEIKPVPGSKIKIFDILELTVIDDIGATGTEGFVQYFYLYDFEKFGVVRNKYIYKEAKKGERRGNKFYDSSLEEVLGGMKQRLGG